MPDAPSRQDRSVTHSLGLVGAGRPSSKAPSLPRRQGIWSDVGSRGDLRWRESCVPRPFACDAIAAGSPPAFLKDVIGLATWTPLKRGPPGRRRAKRSRSGDSCNDSALTPDQGPTEPLDRGRPRSPAVNCVQEGDGGGRSLPATALGSQRLRRRSQSPPGGGCEVCGYNESSSPSDGEDSTAAPHPSSNGPGRAASPEAIPQEKVRVTSEGGSLPPSKLPCAGCLEPCETCRLWQFRKQFGSPGSHRRAKGDSRREGGHPEGLDSSST